MKTDLENFTASYINAMYFSDTGPDTEIPAYAELSEETRLDIEADCRSFWRRFGCYVITDKCAEEFEDPVSQAGHDFHFTRNGHGVGFWEPEWPQPYRDMFDKAAKGYGDFDIYLGDDGLIYS